MREEKKYLVREVSSHLAKSEYVFLANHERVTVEDAEDLRTRLSSQSAEYHVVKNRILKVAARERSLPDISDGLDGHTAIIVGGNDPTEVAKIITKFFKDKDKCPVKVGVLGDTRMSAAEVEAFAKLPSKEVLRAQLLGLFNQPAQQMVRVMQAVPEGLLNVLKAYSEK